MIDYKDIIIKHYMLNMSGRQIATAFGVSKSGVNDFLKTFETCRGLSFPLQEGITNYGIAELVYGRVADAEQNRDLTFELPDFEEIKKQMNTRTNMTLTFLWGRYRNRCIADGKSSILTVSSAAAISPGVKRTRNPSISLPLSPRRWRLISLERLSKSQIRLPGNGTLSLFLLQSSRIPSTFTPKGCFLSGRPSGSRFIIMRCIILKGFRLLLSAITASRLSSSTRTGSSRSLTGIMQSGLNITIP